MELSQWWQLLIAGGAGAGLIKLLDNLLVHLLNRKAKKQDSKAMSMDEMQDRLDKIEERQRVDYAHLKLIDERLLQNDLAEQAMMKAIHALLNHGISNNATGEMKTARDNLVNFIIDKNQILINKEE
jgi:hypothetical protein